MSAEGIRDQGSGIREEKDTERLRPDRIPDAGSRMPSSADACCLGQDATSCVLSTADGKTIGDLIDAAYAKGVADGFKQGAGACASKCAQIAADGLPQPQADGQ